MIPLRAFVMYTPASPNALFNRLQWHVQQANNVFREAGVQFYVSTFKNCAANGTFADVTLGNSISFAAAQGDLQCAFPWLADPQTGDRLRREWLDWAAVEYADHELTVWLHQAGGPNGILPAEGTGLHLPLLENDVRPWLMAHELGHTLGCLSHADQVDARWHNPRTNELYRPADAWDLIYDDMNPPRFFNSRSEAISWGDSGLPYIRTNATNWSADACGKTQAELPVDGYGNSEWYTSPAPQLKGFTAQTQQVCDPGTGAPFFAMNVMHMSPPADHGYGFFSTSQIERIQNYLRYEYDIEGNWALQRDSGKSHGITRLGRGMNREPAYHLDFNGDGRRDIAWWVPPALAGALGTITILMSPGYGTPTTISFGRLGDIPVPADYNGDGVTDIAMFTPGGGINYSDPWDNRAYWRWCNGTNCSSPTTAQFGNRGDIPLPGLDFDGTSSTAELAVFVPKGTFNLTYFRWAPATSPATSTFKYVGTRKSVPLPGLYDNDSTTDLVVYDPDTAQFKVLLSSSAWNTTLTRDMGDPSLVGLPSSNTSARSAAIPIRGMKVRRWVGTSGGLNLYAPRSVLSLWAPWDGKWHTMWDPVNGSTPDRCQWGSWGDRPLGGIGTAWNTHLLPTGDHSAYTVYRDNAFGGNGYLYFMYGAPGACSSTTTSRYSMYFKPESQVTAVRDMDLDKKPDILIINPIEGVLRYMLSGDDFTSTYPISMGTDHAVVL